MRPFVRITGRIVSRMPPTVPRQEIERRIAAFQAALAERELDAALIVESSDLYYLTGTNQDAHLVVPADGQPVYLVRRDLDRARDESPLERVEPLRSLRDLGPAIREAAGDIASLGLEFDVLPVANYLRYAEGAARRRPARLHAGSAAAARGEVGVGGRSHPGGRRADQGAYAAVPRRAAARG